MKNEKMKSNKMKITGKIWLQKMITNGDEKKIRKFSFVQK